jgi:hypothetical protein
MKMELYDKKSCQKNEFARVIKERDARPFQFKSSSNKHHIFLALLYKQDNTETISNMNTQKGHKFFEVPFAA